MVGSQHRRTPGGNGGVAWQRGTGGSHGSPPTCWRIATSVWTASALGRPAWCGAPATPPCTVTSPSSSCPPRVAGDPDVRARFRREAVAAASLNHPAAVGVYDYGEDDGHAFLVMELVEGPTLADVLRCHDVLPPPVAATIARQVAQALGAAHAQRVIHRDVKASNVLVTGDGSAKIGDFGIAKALGDGSATITQPGTVVGSVTYLAPEQLLEEEVGPPADVYALGILLYECLTGQVPFHGQTQATLATQRLTAEVPSPRRLRPEVSEALADAVVRATRREVRFLEASRPAAAPPARESDLSSPARSLPDLLGAAGEDPLSRLWTWLESLPARHDFALPVPVGDGGAVQAATRGSPTVTVALPGGPQSPDARAPEDTTSTTGITQDLSDPLAPTVTEGLPGSTGGARSMRPGTGTGATLHR